MNEWNNNNGHNDGLPSFDEFEEKKAPLFGDPNDANYEFKDRGFVNPKDYGYNAARMDLIPVDDLARWLNTSPASARRRLSENKVWVQKSGRKALVPRVSAETLVVRSWKTLELEDENDEA